MLTSRTAPSQLLAATLFGPLATRHTTSFRLASARLSTAVKLFTGQLMHIWIAMIQRKVQNISKEFTRWFAYIQQWGKLFLGVYSLGHLLIVVDTL
jgi:hypothetical protein